MRREAEENMMSKGEGGYRFVEMLRGEENKEMVSLALQTHVWWKSHAPGGFSRLTVC